MDMGYMLEPFNMRRENEEGKFDEGGHYVKNLDEEKAVTDAWLDTVDMGEKESTFRTLEEKRKLELKKQRDSLGGAFAAKVEGMDGTALRTELAGMLVAG